MAHSPRRMGHGEDSQQCPMPNAQCPMPNAQCPCPNLSAYCYIPQKSLNHSLNLRSITAAKQIKMIENVI
jgi:hypothetical protein